MRESRRVNRDNHPVTYKLTILVCGLPSRAKTTFSDIIIELNRQTIGRPVELLALTDNKSMSVGDKRILLLSCATGDYVAFVDDDDMVTVDYIPSLLEAIETGVDVITFQVKETETRGDQEIIRFMDFDVAYGKNHTVSGVRHFIPDHLCCFKRGIALQAEFPDKSLGEDHIWAENVRPFIKSQHKIDRVMYYYNFDKNKSETRGR